MANRISTHPLHREVLPPQKQPSGFGVVVVAALAMFMAVASSAMVLRARMVRATCPASHTKVVAPQASPAPSGIELSVFRECGTPVYQQNVDGSVSVYFNICPHETSSPWGIRSADPATPTPATPTMEIVDIRHNP